MTSPIPTVAPVLSKSAAWRFAHASGACRGGGVPKTGTRSSMKASSTPPDRKPSHSFVRCSTRDRLEGRFAPADAGTVCTATGSDASSRTSGSGAPSRQTATTASILRDLARAMRSSAPPTPLTTPGGSTTTGPPSPDRSEIASKRPAARTSGSRNREASSVHRAWQSPHSKASPRHQPRLIAPGTPKGGVPGSSVRSSHRPAHWCSSCTR